MLKCIVLPSVLSLGLGVELKTIPPYNEIMCGSMIPGIRSDPTCNARPPPPSSSEIWRKYLGGPNPSNGYPMYAESVTDTKMRWNIKGSHLGKNSDPNDMSGLWDLIETINNNIEEYNIELNKELNTFQNKINEYFQQQNKERHELYQKKIQELEKNLKNQAGKIF